LFREISSIKRVEVLKQELLNQFDYSILSIFRAIDQFSHGTINRDNLRTFLLNFNCASEVQQADIENWIRRYDKGCDRGLKFSDLITALETQTPYIR